MSAPAKCPSCGTRLQSEWENCPNCPLSFIEETPGSSLLKSDRFQDFVMPALFFLALGFGTWTLGQYLYNLAKEGGPEQGVAGARRREGPPPNAVGSAAEEEQETISIMSEERSASSSVPQWRLRGTVYDLLSLSPVPACVLVFTDAKSGDRAQTMTDARGRYRAWLEPLKGRGYSVSIVKSGYAKTYLEPGSRDPGLMDVAQRDELARMLSATVKTPVSLQPPGGQPLVTDFYLAPLPGR